jgi:hypothetical protein
MKEITEMTLEDLINDRDELMLILEVAKAVGGYELFNWKGLDYWSAERRYYYICQYLNIF